MHLTNYTSGKSVWPVYLTIGNIILQIHDQPIQMSSMPVALIPNPLTVSKYTTPVHKWFMQDCKPLIIQEVIANLIKSIDCNSGETQQFYDNNSMKFYAYCADGYVWLCFSWVAGWISNYPEHIKIQELKLGLCFWWKMPASELHNYTNQFQDHDWIEYKCFYTANDCLSLQIAGVIPKDNPLWHLQGAYNMPILCLTDLPKPDILHTILLGTLGHLMEWNLSLLDDLGKLDEFDTAFKSSPAYLCHPAQKKHYQEVVQWAGIDMCNMAHILLVCLYVTLRWVHVIK
jgi:hypothetical protein